MTSYNDKIDASYAKLKTVLSAAASAAAGFKSAQSKKSQVKSRDLSQEIVGVLLEELQRFIMHMTSASVDQISGRVQAKLAKLGVSGFLLSDDAVKKIKAAVAEINPDAAEPVAQIVNSAGAEKQLEELDGFFKKKPAGEGKEGKEGKDKDEAEELLDKSARDKFAKYLDKDVFPKSEYFDLFFGRIFSAVTEAIETIERTWSGIRLVDDELAKQTIELAKQVSKAAVSNVALAASNVELAVSNSSLALSMLVDAGSTAALAAFTALLAVSNMALAAAVLMSMAAIAVTVIGAVVSSVVSVMIAAGSFILSVVGAAAGVAAAAIGFIVAVAASAAGAVVSVIIAAASVIVSVVISALVVGLSILAMALSVVLSAVVIAAALIIVAAGLAVAAVLLGVALVAAAVVASLAVVVAVSVAALAAVSAVVLFAALAVAAIALAVAAVVVVAAVLAVAITLAAVVLASVFAVFAVFTVVLALAAAALAVAAVVAGLAIAAGVVVVGAAAAAAVVALAAAALAGIATVLGVAVLIAAAVLGAAVLAIGLFLAAVITFTGIIIAAVLSAPATAIALITLLLIVGIMCVAETVQEILDLLQPYWEKIKSWWGEIQKWWEGTFVKKILDDKNAAGGWLPWALNLISGAVKKLSDVLADTQLGKWVKQVAGWWKSFSIKNILVSFWKKFKSWVFEKWNAFCQWLSQAYISYPSGFEIIYKGNKDDSWWKKANPLNYGPRFTWDQWHPFGFLAGMKVEIPEATPRDMPRPGGDMLEQDMSQNDEMQQYIDSTEADSLPRPDPAANIFEQDRLRKEAIRRKREELKNKRKAVVVPQVITYQDSPGAGQVGGVGLYGGQLGSMYMR